METKAHELRFYEFAKKCDAIIFARLAPNQKA
jgi:magnesium-transporting ATPase (P-type)